MDQYQRSLLYRFKHQIIAVALALVGLVLIFWPLSVLAQSGCVGDPCVFYTPTATQTPTPVPTPLTGTPTAVPMPSPIPFPEPNYDNPTSIPTISYPDVPSPLELTPIPIPSVISFSTPVFSDSTPVPLNSISTSITISYSSFISIDSGVTGTEIYSIIGGVIGQGQGIISDVTSYTNYISGQIASMQYTESFTIATAPDWYAPKMPRDYANVGWTFELMNGDMYAVKRYSVATWSSIFGYMAALPIKLIKMIWELFRFLGPFGLFLIWLLVVMLPFVLGIKILLFLVVLFVRFINFVLTIVDWILKLWGALPFI
jgi:hypothetical protein